MIPLPIKLTGMILLLTSTCWAEFEVAKGAVQLETSLSGVYDSNIRSASDEIADEYLALFPLLRFRRLGGRFNTDASAGVLFKRYQDHTEFNSEDARAQFNWSMIREDGETTGATLGIGYVETSDAIVEVNDRVRARNFFVTNSGEVLVADRHLLSAGFSYRDNQHNIGSDQKSASGRIGYSYVGIPDGTTVSATYSHQRSKSTDAILGDTVLDQTADTATVAVTRPLYADLVAGVSYGYRWLDRGAHEAALALPDLQGPVIDLTLKGPFLPKKYFPKTTGTFRLAYEQSDAPGLNDSSRHRFVGLVNVSWAARERTMVSLYASRTQELSIRDFTVVNKSTGLKITQGIGNFVTTNLDLRYTNADFVNLLRTDERYEAEVSAAYQVNRAWSANMAYRYLDSRSDTAIAVYQRHLVTLTLRYAL